MGLSVTILGSNSALPTSDRNPTAQVLNASERFFLFDCGEGTQMQLRRNRVRFGRINHIFVSHLHGDHVFGLPGLISSFGLLGRTKDLHIYAHSDLEMILKPLMAYFSRDLPYNVVFHHVRYDETQIVFEDDLIEISTFPLVHRISTVGYLIKEKLKERKINKQMCHFHQVPLRWLPRLKKGEDFLGEDGVMVENSMLTFPPPLPKSYAFCSDTKYSESVIPYIRGVDVLYHESTFLSNEEQLAAKTFHSTARQAAQIAKKAEVGKLLIGHFSSRYKDLSLFIAEARSVFQNSAIAEEGKVFDI
jgi:ribonuclease Z